jgi:hypothetical protein
MAFLGYSEQPHAFATEVLGMDRSDKIQNICNDRNRISTEILVQITTKVVSKDGYKVNGHWLITGEGPMFLGEKPTSGIKTDEPAISEEKKLIATLEKSVAIFEKDIENLWDQNKRLFQIFERLGIDPLTPSNEPYK